ncbi:indole-3-acetaldehyde oxidase-like [Helicoverpa zea]|uniref:indole-3-acetaldehyde oxidase-like n=1 Tax=Helicoverpa zea TaxID=7113 RepID=UPI001F568704|nr:indole-3-acetaldehyde oxidase-like [Helicoverpa zea]
MDRINFTINGERFSLTGTEVSPQTSLNDYIRNYLQLHGTKAMCYEGGCGACVVSVAQAHPVTKEKHIFAVNSCLVHILSCHDWDITTVEGVGNRKDGYHPIQDRLASFNGTQCGYCTPGWIMNMYSLSKAKKDLTTKEVEDSFGGNMCRCTGYRPILDAFKSFATDTDPGLQNKLQDLEDLHIKKCAKKCTRKCSSSDDEWCIIEDKQGSLMQLNTSAGRWYKANTVQDIFKVLSREGTNSYRLVAGNTGRGVYPIKLEPKILIDISTIENLKLALADENLILGAGMSLTEVMKTFKEWPKKNADFGYLATLHDHLDLVAHVPVRNIGTIGGNLAMKNKHPDFPSDLYLMLLAVGATVTIVSKDLSKVEVKMQDFLKTDLNDKLIFDVKLPPLSNTTNIVRTYKIMPRAQNAHAIVNAGFLFKVDCDKKVTSCNIVYGNICPTFTKATETEKLLVGQKLFTNEVLLKTLMNLSQEVMPVEIPPEPSAICRQTLALGLFYKAVLSGYADVNKRYKSGGSILKRPVSHGTQTYETDKTLWPLNQPIPKLEALSQCSGEATYACDVFSGPRTVHVAFVLSDVCRAEIIEFDVSEALQMPGVIAFFSAKDIPGSNSFTPTEVPWMIAAEEILASKNILYYGQPVGVIAAVTRRAAEAAAEVVKVKYKKLNDKPVLNIRDALEAHDKETRLHKEVTLDPSRRGTDVRHTITGSFSVPGQYHYTMELQSCATQVTENGLVVRSATQWMDLVQVAVAKMLDMDENRILVEVPRVGGGYGGKASRSALVACASALVAHKLNRAAVLVLPLTQNMQAIGKRSATEFQYECGVNSDGLIQYLNVTYYSDCGCSFNDSPASSVATVLTNLYMSDTWKIVGYSVLTDTASATWCRAPSTTEGTAFIEHIMERISHVTNKDHVAVRLTNLSPKHDTLREMISTFTMTTSFNDRKAEIAKFNSDNAWKKRGLKISIMSYPIEYSWNYPVTISVYHGDGTIAISHGGIEMGQGINTKMAQVCAYTLKVPLEKVVIRGADSFVSPNAMVSNGSITSDSVAFATVKACEDLNKRLEAAKKELNEPTWEEVVKTAYEKGINLQVTYMSSPNDGLVGYNVYGVCAAEVELDVLTGNHIVSRLDLLEDTGVSMSPEIDVGQIEGAFIMGLGLWTSEKLVFEESTGRLLTDRTWTYKPPGAKDIPVDFRIMFRRNSTNAAGVLRSKATGEPALVLAVVVTHALHDAIEEARIEFGYPDQDWVIVDTPYNVENILKAISPRIESYKLT